MASSHGTKPSVATTVPPAKGPAKATVQIEHVALAEALFLGNYPT
jgi:hypothetical protein